MLMKKKSNTSETAKVFFKDELADYLKNHKTTSDEREILEAWVDQGHSVYESGGSRYLCDQYPPLDYLETYRTDRRIEKELNGKNEVERELYLRQYMGYDDESSYGSVQPENPAKRIRRLEHELFYLWEYIISSGLKAQADSYLKEHEGEPIPFEYEG